MEKPEGKSVKTPGKPKVFQNHWLNDPEFKGWLSKGQDPETAYCQACAVTVKAGKSELQTHARTKKHCSRLEAMIAANEPESPYDIQQHLEIEYEESVEVDSGTEMADIKHESVEPSPKRRKILNRKVFQKKWLTMPQFEGWLERSDAVDLAFCNKCHVLLQAGKSELLVHARTKKHIMRMAMTPEELEEVLPTQSPREEMAPIPVTTVDLRTDAFVPMKIVKEQDSDEENDDNDEEGSERVMTGLTDYALGTDPKTEAVEYKLASLMGMDSAIFFPSEALANLAAVLAHCTSRGSHVLYGSSSQMAMENDEALRKIAGVATETLPNNKEGSFDMMEAQQLFSDKEIEPPMIRLACIELAFLDKGGRVPSLAWLQDFKDLCDHYVCPIHCDGRMFFQACARYEIQAQMTPKQVASGFASVTVSLHKSFNYPMGAVLIGSHDFIARAKSVRHVLGAETHQLGMTVCVNVDQKLTWFSSELMRAHKSACTIASYLSKSKSDANVWVDPEQIETNVIHLLTKPGLAKVLIKRLEKISPEEHSTSAPCTRILSSYVNISTVRLVINPDITKTQARKIGKKILIAVNDLKFGSKLDCLEEEMEL